MNTLRTRSSRAAGAALAMAALLLPACSGGGGGGSGVTPGPGPGPGPTRTPQTVVYVSEDGLHLFGIADGGGTPVALGSPAFTAIRSFAVSPDGAAVAWIGDCDTADQFELYVRELAAAAPVKVSQLTHAYDDVQDLQWSPDSSRIAYRADDNPQHRYEMFSVRRDGSGSYSAFGPSALGMVLPGYAWSPDGHYLAWLVQESSAFELRLHDATTAAPGSALLQSTSGGRTMVDLAFSPDSRWLAFRSDLPVPASIAQGQFQVFRAATDLSAPPQVANGNPSTTVKVGAYAWSPNSRWLWQTVLQRTTDDKVGVNLYDTAAGTSARIATTNDFGAIAWAPGADVLAFAADYDPATHAPSGQRRLWSYDPAQAALTAIGTPSNGETLRDDLLAWSPDGALVAFATRVNQNTQNRAFLALATGATSPIVVTGTANLEVFDLAWSPDGTRLGVLELDQNAAYHPGYVQIVGDDGIARATASLNTYYTSRRLQWTTDGKRLVFPEATGGTSVQLDRLRCIGSDGTNGVMLGAPALAEPTYEIAVHQLP
ncbi:MAG: hypothetical protein U1E73_06070 [Planctomycetota bacterium]